MKQNKFVIATLVGAVFTAALSACDTPTTSYRDFLNASGTAFLADGKTPASHLSLDRYEWIINYKDGSTVGIPFDSTYNPGWNLNTDSSGKFAFSSSEIDMQSGNLASECWDVCVQSEYDYETVCDYWATDYEEYCWIDEFGYEHCETTSYEYCASYSTVSYEYCSVWGQDCNYYYPARASKDINHAYSEITYRSGSNWITTQSQNLTTPNTALASTSIPVGDNDTSVESYWTQDDVFVTPFSSFSPSLSPAFIAKSKLPGFRVKRARRPVTATLGRSHDPAIRINNDQLDTLTAEQRIKLDTTRATCGAIPKDAQ